MKNCPKCGITWEGEEIPQGLLATGLYGDLEQCKEVAKMYGWTEENGRRFGVNFFYCKDYKEDGTKDRYYRCTNCESRIELTGEIK